MFADTKTGNGNVLESSTNAENDEGSQDGSDYVPEWLANFVEEADNTFKQAQRDFDRCAEATRAFDDNSLSNAGEYTNSIGHVIDHEEGSEIVFDSIHSDDELCSTYPETISNEGLFSSEGASRIIDDDEILVRKPDSSIFEFLRSHSNVECKKLQAEHNHNIEAIALSNEDISGEGDAEQVWVLDKVSTAQGVEDKDASNIVDDSTIGIRGLNWDDRVKQPMESAVFGAVVTDAAVSDEEGEIVFEICDSSANNHDIGEVEEIALEACQSADLPAEYVQGVGRVSEDPSMTFDRNVFTIDTGNAILGFSRPKPPLKLQIGTNSKISDSADMLLVTNVGETFVPAPRGTRKSPIFRSVSSTSKTQKAKPSRFSCPTASSLHRTKETRLKVCASQSFESIAASNGTNQMISSESIPNSGSKRNTSADSRTSSPAAKAMKSFVSISANTPERTDAREFQESVSKGKEEPTELISIHPQGEHVTVNTKARLDFKNDASSVKDSDNNPTSCSETPANDNGRLELHLHRSHASSRTKHSQSGVMQDLAVSVLDQYDAVGSLNASSLVMCTANNSSGAFSKQQSSDNRDTVNAELSRASTAGVNLSHDDTPVSSKESKTEEWVSAVGVISSENIQKLMHTDDAARITNSIYVQKQGAIMTENHTSKLLSPPSYSTVVVEATSNIRITSDSEKVDAPSKGDNETIRQDLQTPGVQRPDVDPFIPSSGNSLYSNQLISDAISRASALPEISSEKKDVQSLSLKMVELMCHNQSALCNENTVSSGGQDPPLDVANISPDVTKHLTNQSLHDIEVKSHQINGLAERELSLYDRYTVGPDPLLASPNVLDSSCTEEANDLSQTHNSPSKESFDQHDISDLSSKGSSHFHVERDLVRIFEQKTNFNLTFETPMHNSPNKHALGKGRASNSKECRDSGQSKQKGLKFTAISAERLYRKGTKTSESKKRNPIFKAGIKSNTKLEEGDRPKFTKSTLERLRQPTFSRRIAIEEARADAARMPLSASTPDGTQKCMKPRVTPGDRRSTNIADKTFINKPATEMIVNSKASGTTPNTQSRQHTARAERTSPSCSNIKSKYSDPGPEPLPRRTIEKHPNVLSRSSKGALSRASNKALTKTSTQRTRSFSPPRVAHKCVASRDISTPVSDSKNMLVAESRPGTRRMSTGSVGAEAHETIKDTIPESDQRKPAQLVKLSSLAPGSTPKKVETRLPNVASGKIKANRQTQAASSSMNTVRSFTSHDTRSPSNSRKSAVLPDLSTLHSKSMQQKLKPSSLERLPPNESGNVRRSMELKNSGTAKDAVTAGSRISKSNGLPRNHNYMNRDESRNKHAIENKSMNSAGTMQKGPGALSRLLRGNSVSQAVRAKKTSVAPSPSPSVGPNDGEIRSHGSQSFQSTPNDGPAKARRRIHEFMQKKQLLEKYEERLTALKKTHRHTEAKVSSEQGIARARDRLRQRELAKQQQKQPS